MKLNLEGIKKNVFFLGLVSLFTDISSEMLYPVIPVFLTAVLGAPMFIVGIIEGIAESTASILKVISGWMSDKSGKRKPFVVAGYSLSAISKPFFALAYTWHFVLFARFLDRFGKGIRSSARDALIADSTELKFRGKAFGFHRSLDTLGAVIGPLFLLVLLYYFNEDYRTIFYIAFIPALISVFFLIKFVSDIKIEKKDKFELKLSDFNNDFKKFLFISIIFALGNSSNAFLILKANDVLENFYLVVLSYMVYNIVHAIAATPSGIISDKIGRRNVMIYGFLIFSFVYFGFAFVNSGHFIWILFAIYGLYYALTDGVSKAYVVDMVSSDKRGTAIGIYYTIIGFISLFASIIAGFLWELIGAYAPFLFGSITGFISAIMLVMFLPKRVLSN